MIDSVLVVDDEPANIHLIKGILPSEIKIRAAISGKVALKQLAKSQPDLILLDLLMPEMDGFETLAQIKQIPECQQIPVIVVSGNANAEDIERTKALGAMAHLLKPINQQDLLALIASI